MVSGESVLEKPRIQDLHKFSARSLGSLVGMSLHELLVSHRPTQVDSDDEPLVTSPTVRTTQIASVDRTWVPEVNVAAGSQSASHFPDAVSSSTESVGDDASVGSIVGYMMTSCRRWSF